MKTKYIQPKIDHSITIVIILFVFILFTALQLTAQEVEKKINKDKVTTQNIKLPNSPQATGDKVTI